MSYQTLVCRLKTALLLAVAVVALGGCGGAEDRIAAHVKKGDTLFAAGDFDKARVEYKNALQIDPKNVQAQFGLGEAMSKLGNYREAVGQYQAVLEIVPDHRDANERLAEIFLQAREPDQARKYIDTLLQTDPRNVNALTFSAATKLLAKDSAGARTDVEQALAVEPHHVRATALSAQMMLQEGRVDDAITAIEQALAVHSRDTDLRMFLAVVHAQQGDTDRAAGRLREVIEIDPKKFAHRLNLARLFASNKRTDEAEQVLQAAIADLPQDNAAKLAYIEFLAGNDKVDVAVTKLREMITANPKEHELRMALGRLYVAQRDLPNARLAFDEIIKLTAADAPENLMARVRLAAIAMQQGNRDEGLKLVNEVLEKNPRDKEGLMLRGSYYLETKAYSSAIADFRAALSDDATDLQVSRLLAAAHLANGDKELGRDTLRRAIDAHPENLQVRAELADAQARDNDVPGAIKTLESILQTQPGHVATLQALFRARAYLKDWDGAAAVAKQVQQAHPNDALGYHLAGLVDQARGDFPTSIRSFESALALSPDAIEPLSQLVRSHMAMKQNKAAVARLEEVISRNDKNFAAHNLLGELQLLSKELASARGSFENAVAIKPDWDRPYNNLAFTQIQLKDDGAARTTLERGIEATNGSALLVTSYATYMESRGHLDEAIKQYESMLTKQPNSDLAKNNLAMLLIEYKSDAASIERARSLTASFENTNNGMFLDTRGWVEYKSGAYASALEYLKRAAEAVPDSKVVQYHLGMAYLQLGNNVDALHHLKLAVDGDSDFRGIDEAKAAIAKLDPASR